MKFSVLMSIYHRENPQHFDECMSSIWTTQSRQPDEIVLVKDGQLTPDLDAVIDRWQQRIGRRFKVLALPSNQGTGKAKNAGLEHCTHEIVCVVDTDDICVPNRFAKQLAFFEAYPDVAVVGGQIDEFIDQPDNIVATRTVPLEPEAIQAFAQRQSPCNHMTVAYKKQAVLAVGGYWHHLYMEDYNLFLRLLAGGYKMANLPDCLVYARIDNGMHARRRGLTYIASEWQLYRLKCSLGLQSPITGLVYFVLRALPRLLPASGLAVLYRWVRARKAK